MYAAARGIGGRMRSIKPVPTKNPSMHNERSEIYIEKSTARTLKTEYRKKRERE